MDYKDSEDRITKCLECGDEIGYGRPDRKFCCPTCKNKYNNRRSQGSRLMKLKVINALNHNHEILSRLLKAGMTEIYILDAKRLGFSFEYVTSFRKVRSYAEFCCFDIKYRLTPTRLTSIYKMSDIPL